MQTEDPSQPLVIRSDLTVDERFIALQLAQQQARLLLGGQRRLPLAIILGAVGIIVLGRNVPSAFSHLFAGWTALMLLIAAVFIAFLFTNLGLNRKLASELSSHLEISCDDQYLLLRHEYATTQYPWAVVASCEIVGKMLAISGRGFLSISVPLRCFESEEAAQRFAEHVRSHMQAGEIEQRTPAPAPTSALLQKQTPVGRKMLVDLWDNVCAGVLLLFFRSSGVTRLRPSSTQFAALALLSLVLSVSPALVTSRGRGFLNWPALPETLFFVVTILGGAWVAASIASRSDRIVPLAVAIAALGIPGAVITLCAYWLFADAMARYPIWWAFVIWTSLASAAAAVRLLEAPPWKTTCAVMAALAILIAPVSFLDFSQQLWIPLSERDAEGSESRARFESASSEKVLYAQPRLLDEALQAIEPGTPGLVELFFVGFAGAGYQDVFVNEVTGAERVLKERFGLGPHGVILANSMRTPEERPFATATALRRTLEVVAQRMNRDEDILFLFLTSHGARNFELEVQMFPFRFKPLGAAALREMLDAVGISNRGIVASACYAGGFIASNESPDTMIITASHADRTSFGCRDGAEWTYFGQAFFSEALSQADSFEDAFALATARIRERESAEKLNASEPQMVVGSRIGESLQILYKTLKAETGVQRGGGTSTRRAAPERSGATRQRSQSVRAPSADRRRSMR